MLLQMTYFNGVQRATGAFGMELDTPDFLPGVVGGLDSLDRGVVAVDEERFPALRERILERQGVLVVLAVVKRDGIRTREHDYPERRT